MLKVSLLLLLCFLGIQFGCGNVDKTVEISRPDSWQQRVIDKYEGFEPDIWSENLAGILTRINSDKKVVALTLDACGGRYDEKLIRMLREKDIKATIFVSAIWIKENEKSFQELASDTLFEIGNHGYRHLPLSVSGRAAYGIVGTGSVQEVIEEIDKNQQLIRERAEIEPDFFRSGTAYYDDLAVEIVYAAGLKPVNYTIAPDSGGTASRDEIVSAISSAQPGDILLLHMNLPDSEIAAALAVGIDSLQSKGFEFVKLQEYGDRLE